MTSIFIGIPLYGNTVDAGCCMALLSSARLLDRLGYDVQIHFEHGNPYVDDSRNRIVKSFLNSGKDKLVFVDSDLSFSPDGIYNLIKYDVDVIGGVYRLKNDETMWTCLLETNDNGEIMGDPTTGLINALHIPAGFSAIKRNVFEQMENLHPEWMVENNGGMTTFFATGNVFGDGLFYGEDVAFCKRWRAMGGKIWIYPDIDFEHIGKKSFYGNFHNFLIEEKCKAEMKRKIEEECNELLSSSKMSR
jgi:hypothetical protein